MARGPDRRRGRSVIAPAPGERPGVAGSMIVGPVAIVDLEVLDHGSSLLAQDIGAFEQLDQATRPSLDLFSTLFVGDPLGQCLGDFRSVDHGSGPFRTTGPAYASALFASYQWDIETVSSVFFSGAFAPCQDHNRDCSGGAADAVRNRSAAPRPAKGGTTGAAASRRCLVSCLLTPTRGDAIRLAASLSGAIGPGCAVLIRTAAEPSQNRQAIEIARFAVRFSWFYAVASRDARAPVCVCTRACTLWSTHRTIEPVSFMYVNQLVSGSLAVLTWFRAEPAMPSGAVGLGSARIADKLDGRYRRVLLGPVSIEACSTLAEGGWRKVLAFRAGRAWPQSADRARGAGLSGRAGGWGGNGGILRFSRGRPERVGRVMLEGMGERRGNQPFQRDRRLPVRLARRSSTRRGGEGAPGRPPHAPSGEPPCPSVLAQCAGRIWIGLPSGHPACGPGTGRGGARLGDPGLQCRVGVRCSAVWDGKPRKGTCASGGFCHVN